MNLTSQIYIQLKMKVLCKNHYKLVFNTIETNTLKQIPFSDSKLNKDYLVCGCLSIYFQNIFQNLLCKQKSDQIITWLYQFNTHHHQMLNRLY